MDKFPGTSREFAGLIDQESRVKALLMGSLVVQFIVDTGKWPELHQWLCRNYDGWEAVPEETVVIVGMVLAAVSAELAHE